VSETSILAQTGNARRPKFATVNGKRVKIDPTTLTDNTPTVPAGRIGLGVRPADVKYLIDLYQKRERENLLDPDGFTVISNKNVFTLQKLAGLPVARMNSGIHNDRSAARIAKMLTQASGDYKFTVIPHSSGGGERAITRYKISDVGILNVGNVDPEQPDTDDDDVDISDILDM